MVFAENSDFRGGGHPEVAEDGEEVWWWCGGIDFGID